MNKSSTTRAAAALMALLVLCGLLFGCLEKPEEPTDTTVSEATVDTQPEETKFDPFAHLGDTDEYRDSEFCFLNGCTASWFTRNSVLSDELDGDAVSIAVARRNDRVKQKYGVTITEISDSNYRTSVETAINTNDLYFDVAMITLMHVYPMAQRHFFYDYHDLEAVDLSEPWWDQNAVNDLSVCGKLYFCTGSFDTTRFDSIRCLAFNKDLLTSLGLESPYTLVDENRWTIDKFIEMGQAAQIDYGEDSRFTDEDTYGLASYDSIICDMLLSGCGIKYLTKNSDDEIIYDMDTDRLTIAVDKIRGILHTPGFTFDSNSSAMKPYLRGMDDRVLEQLLIEGKALFYSECLANTRYFRESSMAYGIIPPPKYDEDQERYYSIMINPFVYTIPAVSDDPQRTGFLLDALMAASHDTVVPAYYDITLVGKIARDPETVRMLGIVFDSLSYNIHISNVTVRSTSQSQIISNSSSVVSALKRISGIIPKTLEQVNGAMRGS